MTRNFGALPHTLEKFWLAANQSAAAVLEHAVHKVAQTPRPLRTWLLWAIMEAANLPSVKLMLVSDMAAHHLQPN